MTRGSITTLILAIGITFTGVPAQAEAASGEKALVSVLIRSDADLQELRAADASVYARLNTPNGPVLLMGADMPQTQALVARTLDVTTLDASTAGRRYYVVYRMPRLTEMNLSAYGRVLLEYGSRSVMEMTPEDAERLAEAGAELRAVTMDAKPLPTTPGGRPAPEAPAAITPQTSVQQMIDQVDSATVSQYAGDLSGEWPVTVGGSPYTIATRHTYSGTPIQKAAQFAGEHLEALGLAVEYHQWSAPAYPNVIGELPGLVSPDSIVIICAHLDDMPAGALAPGADDNASGSSAVLVAADIMSQHDWHYTLRFALWTGEEQGLLGSHAYALRSFSLGESIVGVLNLDMIAYNSIGSDPDVDLHANQSVSETLDLAQLFADAVTAYGLDLIPQIIPDGIGASDHASFTDYGYSAILGIEDLSDFNPRYHTTSDLLQYYDVDYYVDFVKASVATGAHMAGVYAEASAVPTMTGTGCLLAVLLLFAIAVGGLAVQRRRRAG